MAVAPAPAKRICVMSCFLMGDGYHRSICTKHPNSGETHVAIDGLRSRVLRVKNG
jgi:hypothetical protein